MEFYEVGLARWSVSSHCCDWDEQLLEGLRPQSCVRKWQRRETGELADGVSGLYLIIAGSGIFFLLAKLLIFEELQVTASNIYLETPVGLGQS